MSEGECPFFMKLNILWDIRMAWIEVSYPSIENLGPKNQKKMFVENLILNIEYFDF